MMVRTQPSHTLGDFTVTSPETIILAILRSGRKTVDEAQTIHNRSNIITVSVLSSAHTHTEMTPFYLFPSKHQAVASLLWPHLVKKDAGGGGVSASAQQDALGEVLSMAPVASAPSIR